MPLPLILTKFKGLLPVVVVGGAVAITIKLLTQETPTASKIMHVEAEEDIKKLEDFEEVLEDEPEQEEVADVEEEEEAAKEDKEESDDEAAVEEEEEEESDSDSEQQSQQQEQPPSSGRSFIKGEMGDLFSKILGTDKD